MSENFIELLLEEIDQVDFREFWWGSELLRRCEPLRDERVIEALLIRHHCLENKEADSCHVIRNTIKVMDGSEFETLWRFIDNARNSENIIDSIEDPYSLVWAAAYVLGEIGGRQALSKVTGKLRTQKLGYQYLFVRIALHLMVRYFKAYSPEEPMIQEMDIKTGKIQQQYLRDVYPDQYQQFLLRKKQENEYFVPVNPAMLPYLHRHLNLLPDRIFPSANKQQFLENVMNLPTEKNKS